MVAAERILQVFGSRQKRCASLLQAALRSKGAPERSETIMATPSHLMRGRRGLIVGVANNRSIAWGIARACHAHGAARPKHAGPASGGAFG